MIRDADHSDLDRLVELAAKKRAACVGHAPVFHRPHPEAEERHRPFLASLIDDPKSIVLVHQDHGHVSGFVIAIVVPAPPVYDPGGESCLIDDFVVEQPELWSTVGRDLLDAAAQRAKRRGAVQTVVVCGPHDEPKRNMLTAADHIIASEWWTRPLA